MSVLYKALQKAAKENEEQAAVHGANADDDAVSAFDPERFSGSGSMSAGRSRDVNWRVAGAASAVVLAVVGVAVFFLIDSDQPASVQVAQQPIAPVAPATESATSQAQTDAATATNIIETSDTALSSQLGAESDASGLASNESAAVVPEASVALAAPVAVSPVAPAAITPAAPAAIAPSAPMVASGNGVQAPVALVPTALSPQRTAAPAPAQAQPTQSDPMPRLGPDSPARVLSPPISIRRADAEFAGAGDMVQVREVSQSAQDNVTAGYNALVRGDVGSALELYTQAIESEPTSVMAQLGRSASLQRLGRLEEARVGYETVLRIDPSNREALTNLTTIYSARAPNEALSRLLDLEREYPTFSPVKAQIGLLYARMGSNPQALAYLREAASMAPATVMYQYNLAVLLDRLGRAEQAVISYERVLAGILNGGVAGDLSRANIERRVRYLKTL